MINLLQDLSMITDLPKLGLEKLALEQSLCLAHALYESLDCKENIASADLGYGKLFIKYEGDEIKYKFIPSKKFDDLLVKTIRQRKSPLTQSLENSISETLDKIYKELG